MVKIGPSKGAAQRKSWPPDKGRDERPPEDKHVEHTRQSERNPDQHEREDAKGKQVGKEQDAGTQNERRHDEHGHEHQHVERKHVFFRNQNSALCFLARYLKRILLAVAVFFGSVACPWMCLRWIGLYDVAFTIVDYTVEDQALTLPFPPYGKHVYSSQE